MQNTKQAHQIARERLRCKRCGDRGRFVQFSSYAAELVDAEGTYIRLLHIEIDRWECAVCGEEAEWSEVPR
jgi:ribosomal protein S27AE